MKKNLIKIIGILGFSVVVLNSCGPKNNPPLVYFPDMYFPVAYDPLEKAVDPYSKHENTLPPFVKNDGGTAMSPVDGTVGQNIDGVVEVNDGKPLAMADYNTGYDASKSITTSPLNPQNQKKDIERGKLMYDRTCAVCHGTAGDGQGPIVKSGAYQGVPNYKDREITVGSVHYVLSFGRNAMGSYAGQLQPGDRWRVAMYIMDAFKGGIGQTVAAEQKTEQTAAKKDSTATK